MAQQTFNQYCACRACKIEQQLYQGNMALDPAKLEAAFNKLKELPGAAAFFAELAKASPLYVEGQDYSKLDPTTLSPLDQALFGGWKASWDAEQQGAKEAPPVPAPAPEEPRFKPDIIG